MKKTTLLFTFTTLFFYGCGGSGSNTPPNTEQLEPAAHFELNSAAEFVTQEDTEYKLTIEPNQSPTGEEQTDIVITKAPTKGSLQIGDGLLLIYTPHADVNGSDNFMYKLQKGQVTSDEVSVKVTITAINDAPIISGAPEQVKLRLDESFNFTPYVEDIDTPVEELEFTIENKPNWAQFDNVSGHLFGTPEQQSDVGIFEQILISVSDQDSVTKLAPFTIEVLAEQWQQLASLPEQQGAQLRTISLQEGILALSHPTAVSSAMTCASVSPKPPAFQKYSIAANTWQSLTPPSLPRYHYQAKLFANKLYLFGGTAACHSSTSARTDMEVYDFATKHWTIHESPSFAPSPNKLLTSCANENHLVVFSHSDNMTTLFKLDRNGNWSSEVIPELTGINNCLFVDNTFYLSQASERSPQLVKYALETEQVLQQESIPEIESNNYFTLAASDGSLFVHSAKTVLAYQPEVMQWQVLSANPAATESQAGQTYYLRDFQIETVAGKQYQLGGAFTTQALSHLFVFDAELED